MFITVMFGAGCWELVNPWCSLVTLTAHLKQRGQVSPEATIALLAEDGQLVNLGEDLETSPIPNMGSSLLEERGTYVLVHIVSKWGPRLSFAAKLDCKGGIDHPRPFLTTHFVHLVPTCPLPNPYPNLKPGLANRSRKVGWRPSGQSGVLCPLSTLHSGREWSPHPL
ncbi:uncharacterized protein C22orf15 homolog isoform X1 [Castor canadensis]|uniref:Uncharacterized protein C22orf15 homolog isoform X1 n=1 Tax=Castor canadensis TaxID=51338 RepID=A0AC58LHZ5_CASCN